MRDYLLVGLGAACGGALRYWLSGVVQRLAPLGLPYGTLAVNVAGSFALGLIVFGLDARELIPAQLKLVLTVGLCGGFTTFSTFAFETVNLLRDAEYLFAILNIGLNLFLTLLAVALAYVVSQLLSGTIRGG